MIHILPKSVGDKLSDSPISGGAAKVRSRCTACWVARAVLLLLVSGVAPPVGAEPPTDVQLALEGALATYAGPNMTAEISMRRIDSGPILFNAFSSDDMYISLHNLKCAKTESYHISLTGKMSPGQRINGVLSVGFCNPWDSDKALPTNGLGKTLIHAQFVSLAHAMTLQPLQNVVSASRFLYHTESEFGLDSHIDAFDVLEISPTDGRRRRLTFQSASSEAKFFPTAIAESQWHDHTIVMQFDGEPCSSVSHEYFDQCHHLQQVFADTSAILFDYDKLPINTKIAIALEDVSPWYAFFGLLGIAIAIAVFRHKRKKRHLLFIENYNFPDALRKKFAAQYPQLDTEQTNLVFDSLRDYFWLCRQAKRKMVAMPSQAVDDAWHEFILFTRAYKHYCRKALGRFLHHTPAEAMASPIFAEQGIRRAWRLACAREQINPLKPDRLPMLFAIDALLQVPNGFTYVLNCQDRESPAFGSGFCATHIGCASSCAGDTSPPSCGGDGGDGGDGDGGGGCGGGCGGD